MGQGHIPTPGLLTGWNTLCDGRRPFRNNRGCFELTKGFEILCECHHIRVSSVLDFRDHKSFEIFLQNWQQQVCEARNGSHPNSWPRPGLGLGAGSGANWLWHVSAAAQLNIKLQKNLENCVSLWAFNWTFVKLLLEISRVLSRHVTVFVFPTLRHGGDVMCGWCSNVNPSQKYSFQLTVTTFRRMFLLGGRQWMRTGGGEGEASNCLLLTAWIAQSSSTKITTLCQTFSLFIVCLHTRLLKSKNDGLVLHNFLENVFKWSKSDSLLTQMDFEE